jgi:hypothetical protein
MNSTVVDDANIVAAYLGQTAGTPNIDIGDASTAVVLVGSGILPTMRAVFDHLSDIDVVSPVTLVLCGGIGHSTPLLRTAICTAYPSISKTVLEDLPEARIFEKAMRMGWPELCGRIDRGEIGLLVEEQSTNCGANANLAVEVMFRNRISPERLIVVQDPTMMRRTIASFDKAYDSLKLQIPESSFRPDIIPWSTFTPHLLFEKEEIKWDITDFYDRNVSLSELWTLDRFLGLIIGEISRLNDDEDGYGPKGKGFIGHINIPEEVLESWKRLRVAGGGREAQS